MTDGTRALDELRCASDDQLVFGPTTSLSPVYDVSECQVVISVNAYLQGLFVLSYEIAEDGGRFENVLTCYRRNRFQVAGDVSLSSWPTSLSCTASDRETITQLTVQLTAVESRDWKKVAILSAPSRDPAASASSDGPPDEELTVAKSSTSNEQERFKIPISWDRLQFRSATANNGRKRREIRQQFRVDVSVFAKKVDGSQVCIAMASSSFLSVRGRTPRNFQSRNDQPLYSSSLVPPFVSQHDELGHKGAQDQFPGDATLTHPPAVSFSEATTEGSYSQSQVIYSPTMWDWIDISAVTMDNFDPDIFEQSEILRGMAAPDHFAPAQPLNLETGQDGILSWPDVNANLLETSGNPALGFGDFTGRNRSPPPVYTSSQQSVREASQEPIHVTNSPERIYRNEPTSDPAVFRQETVALEVTPSTVTDSSSGPSALHRRGRYTYVPIGLDGWLPPVEPVYWPHPWSHTHKSPT